MRQPQMSRADRAARRKEIADRYASGESIASLMASYSAAESYVRSALTEHRIAPRHERTPRAKASTYRVLADLINTVDTYAAIAQRHNLTTQRVGQIARDAREAGIALHVTRLD